MNQSNTELDQRSVTKGMMQINESQADDMTSQSDARYMVNRRESTAFNRKMSVPKK